MENTAVASTIMSWQSTGCTSTWYPQAKPGNSTSQTNDGRVITIENITDKILEKMVARKVVYKPERW